MSDHTDQGSNDLLIGFVQGCGLIALHVLGFDSELQPDLCLSRFTLRIGELADESRLIAAFASRLRQISAYRARRSPYLIRQSVGFLFRKCLRYLKDLHRCIKGLLIDLQIPVRPDSFVHPGLPLARSPCHPVTVSPCQPHPSSVSFIFPKNLSATAPSSTRWSKVSET